MKSNSFQKEWIVYLLLFLLSFGIYFFYYQHLILHLNSVLFAAEGDSIKNYYTYAYHIGNDGQALHFSGMNYPFGEHVVYTDCQPLLSGFLRLLPFTHDYSIGILHGLILLSFIITPLILYRIFRDLDVAASLSFFSSLAIALLSPQIQRLGGHFALAYGCVIPLTVLFLIRYLKQPSATWLAILFFYSFCLFFIHPYFGLGVSAFCFLSMLLSELLTYDKGRLKKRAALAAVIGVGPIFCFKLLMNSTDHHHHRPQEPYGADIMAAAANPESVFTPSFGPFLFLKNFIKADKTEWEGLSYIGFFPALLLAIALLALPFYFRKLSVRKDLAAMFITAVLLLLFAFGLHIRLLQVFNLQIKEVNQFRAFGRFAWYFYFLLPIFLVVLISNLSARLAKNKRGQLLAAATGLLFLCFNLAEAHYLLTQMTTNTFQARNIFNKQLLTADEQSVLTVMKEKGVSAIIPFPVFHIGSEMYQRNGEASVKPAMLYSYHAALPLLSVMMSRTSLAETEASLEILNRYKRKRPIDSLLAKQHFMILKTGDALMEDEQLVLKGLAPVKQTTESAFYLASPENFKMAAAEKDSIREMGWHSDTAKNVLYIAHAYRPPFISTRINMFTTITVIDSNVLAEGNYIMSFHYHLIEKKFRYIHNNSIVVKTDAQSSNWEFFHSVRSASGFYGNFIVVEQKIKIDPHFQYGFYLNGAMDEYYKISHFLIRPETLDVKMQSDVGMLYNNYPE